MILVIRVRDKFVSEVKDGEIKRERDRRERERREEVKMHIFERREEDDCKVQGSHKMNVKESIEKNITKKNKTCGSFYI